MKKNKTLKVAFIHGRPKGHPTHAKYAQSVGSVFFHEDRLIRWQDIPSSKLRRYLSWITNAFFFSKLRSWDIFLTEGVRVPQLIQKKLRLTSKRQKLIAMMSDESLYFTASGKFPKLTKLLMTEFWKACDAIICVGKFQTELAKSLLPENQHSKVYTFSNGVPKLEIERLNKTKAKLDSKTIVFVGNAGSIWRTEYKGLDLMIEVIIECMEQEDLEFKIAGQIPKSIQDYLLKDLPPQKASKISFLGKVDDLAPVFQEGSLYLHTARGEAWGISIHEALAAGLPAIVSDQTGAKEMVSLVQDDFVVPLEKEAIKNRIFSYMNASLSHKKIISAKAKEVAQLYTEEEAIENFKNNFHQAIEVLN
ncbi:MAG: glycosyltransferase family 4 protein [Flavobacteriales bacterium]|nr:glycosyltransferase family 4 protein [Flavobacteriales bacterium]